MMTSNDLNSSIREMMRSTAYWNTTHPDSARTRKVVTDWFVSQYSPGNEHGKDRTDVQTIHPQYFIDRIKFGKTLFLGEGNLSFALSIATMPNSMNSNIIATVYEEGKYITETAEENAKILENLGVLVQFGIDATHLEKYQDLKFKTIIFQFPHIGSREPIYGRNPNFVLIRRFLKSAISCLDKDGQVIISAVDNSYYKGAFRFEEAAQDAGYNIPEIFNFDLTEFPGYTHTNTNDDESAIDKHDEFKTWIFTKNSD